jgi:hypothetical protein
MKRRAFLSAPLILAIPTPAIQSAPMIGGTPWSWPSDAQRIYCQQLLDQMRRDYDGWYCSWLGEPSDWPPPSR